MLHKHYGVKSKVNMLHKYYGVKSKVNMLHKHYGVKSEVNMLHKHYDGLRRVKLTSYLNTAVNISYYSAQLICATSVQFGWH
jgi:hypothetical protein